MINNNNDNNNNLPTHNMKGEGKFSKIMNTTEVQNLHKMAS